VATSDVLPMNVHDFVSPICSPETLGCSYNSRSSQKLGFGVDSSTMPFYTIVVPC
jgi:hypothetical protein